MATTVGRADLPRTTVKDAPSDWLLRAGRPLMRALVRHRYDVELVGAEHVPARGPVIVAGNHIGFLDGPLAATMTPRPVHLLAKYEMYHGAMGWFLSATGQIPVRRGEPDPASVRGALRLLRDGGVLGIFPEGGRCAGELAWCHPGVGYFAMAAGASVVPLAVLGTRLPGGELESLPPKGSRIVLTFGEPVPVAHREWPRRTREVRETTSVIRNAMLATMRSALDATGMRLPGPVPEGDTP